MYLSHFALTDMPFGLTPNTGFYVGLHGHQQALEVLFTAIGLGEGFLKVTGEVGTGKTLLCRKLLQEAPTDWQVAYVPDPHIDPLQLRWAIAIELGLNQSGNIDAQQLHHLLQRQLLLLAAQGKRVVVLIDEAQALPDDTLEALRLMSNLETEQRKLLQVVLFGQPELDARLAKSRFRQLRQRISFAYRLPKLSHAEVCCYVQERLQRAGNQQIHLFSRAALWWLSITSRGIPRLVNILAHKALMVGYGKGLAQIDCWCVSAAARDTDDVQWPSLPSWLWFGLALMSLIFAWRLMA